MRRVAGVLSPLEIAPLRAAVRGTRDDGIADQLRISEADVRTHLRHVYAKLGVGSRPALVRYAQDNALI